MTDDQIADDSKSNSFVYFLSITKQQNAQWKLLGTKLKLDMSVLDTIQKDNPGDSTACRMEMLHVWLKEINPTTPKVMLENALKEIQKTTHSKGRVL